MKLCRFELLSDPDTPRAGIVYEGKIYETDGEQAAGVHEVADTRLLTPIGIPSSVRVVLASDPNEYFYVNPASIRGPNDAFEIGEGIRAIPCIAAVISQNSKPAQPFEADDVFLGLTLGTLFRDGNGSRQSDYDLALALGPALTTPDELDDRVTEDERGRKYHFKMEFGRSEGDLVQIGFDEFDQTLAELLCKTCERQIIRTGDLFVFALDIYAFGPLGSGDQTRVAGEKLGVLANQLI